MNASHGNPFLNRILLRQISIHLVRAALCIQFSMLLLLLFFFFVGCWCCFPSPNNRTMAATTAATIAAVVAAPIDLFFIIFFCVAVPSSLNTHTHTHTHHHPTDTPSLSVRREKIGRLLQRFCIHFDNLLTGQKAQTPALCAHNETRQTESRIEPKTKKSKR